jgi:predicted dehydrogenase
MKKRPITRREFIASSSLALAMPTIIPGSALGKNGAVAPSNRLTFGIIGFGGRCRGSLWPWFKGFEEVRVLAVCDCWTERRKQAKQHVNAHYRNTDCAEYVQIPDILARDDLDGVIIATGDRMHAIASIMAAKAGKDVYSEKPHSLTIEEGRALVRTTDRYGTVYQCGHQRRSVDTYRFQKEMVRAGAIGKVHTVYWKTWANGAAGPVPDSPVPAGLEWNTWLGGTPYHPYNQRRHRGWNNFFDTGCGSMCNMGTHYSDLAQWGLDRDGTGPVHYTGTAYFDPNNVYDIPVTSKVTATYADGVKLILDNTGSFGTRTIRFEGDGGWIQVDDGNMKVTGEPAAMLKRQHSFSRSYNDMGGHVSNFLECMKSRNRKTTCDPESAHRATTICHTGNICARLGRDLTWDPVKERFSNDDEANRMISRTLRHPWHL